MQKPKFLFAAFCALTTQLHTTAFAKTAESQCDNFKTIMRAAALYVPFISVSKGSSNGPVALIIPTNFAQCTVEIFSTSVPKSELATAYNLSKYMCTSAFGHGAVISDLKMKTNAAIETCLGANDGRVSPRYRMGGDELMWRRTVGHQTVMIQTFMNLSKVKPGSYVYGVIVRPIQPLSEAAPMLD